MESSDLQQQHHVLRSPGLMRYQSAPSSYMADLIDREFCQQFFAKPSSPETERIFARFMNSDDNDDFDPPKPIPTTTTAATMPLTSNIDNYSSPTFNYQSASKPPLPAVSQGLSSGAEPQAPYSMGIAPPQFPPMRTGGVAASSGLVRHSSSPAGFFANLNIDTSGYGAMRGMESYGGGGNSNSSSKGVNEQVSFPTASPASRLKRTSSIGPMSPIPEIVDDKANVVQDSSNNEYVPSGFPWDDTDIMSDRVSKRIRDDHDVKPFSGLHLLSENQNNSVEGDGGNRPPALAHHLSLPKTQAEMAAIEKYLQFQDSVPCKIRAKRGCATHPRSIAERVRRTRISERMRKLQDLVPNMEKQTNTADMLDLAVEYIKDLQSQVQTLNESRAKCTCSNKQQ